MAQKPKHMILKENVRTDSEPFTPFFFDNDEIYELIEGKLQGLNGSKYYFRDINDAQWGAYTAYSGWDSNTRRKEASKLIKNLETLRDN